MNRRFTIIGVAVLCALALSAIAATGASAGTTAFTCVNEGPFVGANKFTEEHCKTVNNTTGTWGHRTVAAGETTVITLTSLTNPKLEGKLFGANVTLEATGVECIECSFENREVEIAGVKTMEVVGPAAGDAAGHLTFTGVKVVGLEEKCEVVGTKAEDISTMPLKFTTTVSTGATLEPATGTILAEFGIKAKTGKECSVAGSGFKVTGSSKATLSGATLNVNVTKESGELKLEGEKAALKGEATLKIGKPATVSEPNPVHRPGALTPTTP